MIKIDRALKEVWNWKEQIYKETKASTIEKQISLICEQAKKSSECHKLESNSGTVSA